MSQHDYNIANGGGAAVRADLNNALLAILSQNSGATAPTTTKPFMLWYDTTTGILKIRNAADNAWVTFAAGAIADASIAQAKLAANVAGNGPAFSAYPSGAQTLANATWTKMVVNTEEFDTNSNYDAATNYRFQPNIAGYYSVSGQVTLSGSTNVCSVGIYKNGNVWKNGVQTKLDTNFVSATVSAIVYLNGSTDYVELYGYNQSGGNNNTYVSGVGYGWFQGHMVRAA